ncbi:MAG: hypothetical protein ACREN2_01210 [Candidatus Dormibacteria bacterium]
MNEAIRFFWNAAAVAGAVVVGVFTHDAGLIAITLIGGLIVPRMLGLVPRRGFLGYARRYGWGGGPGGWHRGGFGAQCGENRHSAPPSAPPASTI